MRAGDGPSWLSRLLAEPSAFDPFLAMSLLEGLAPDAPRIGGDGPFYEEALRLRHSRGLSFRPGDMDDVQVVEDGRRTDGGRAQQYELSLNIVGLTGTSSPLPTYLASEAASNDEEGNVKADFFDLFHHRLHSLLYRALCKYDWARDHDVEGDVWSQRMLSVLGVDVYDRAPLKYIRPIDLLRIAPLMASSARTAKTLELAILEILRHQLDDATVEVKQFKGEWADIDRDHKIKLAVDNSNLGVSAVIGDMCLHRAGKAQVVVGPLDQEGLRRFLAGGEAFLAVRELLDLLSYELVDFELELILGKAARTGTILGRSKLGDDAWLESGDEGGGSREQTRMIVSLSEALEMMEEGEL